MSKAEKVQLAFQEGNQGVKGMRRISVLRRAKNRKWCVTKWGREDLPPPLGEFYTPHF